MLKAAGMATAPWLGGHGNRQVCTFRFPRLITSSPSEPKTSFKTTVKLMSQAYFYPGWHFGEAQD
jgi:hypothetical protein